MESYEESLAAANAICLEEILSETLLKYLTDLRFDIK